MTNIIKMSLVAAVAVAGLSSNVSAQPLEEAIKNVDITGSVLYRYNDYQDDENDATKSTDNYYKIATTLKSKVNDTVTATVRVIGSNSSTGGLTGNDTTTNADENFDVTVSHANFTIDTGYATVIAGKQGLTTPWTVAIDADGDEQTGTGVLALIPAGPVTLAAAYFNQTNLGTTSALKNTDATKALATTATRSQKADAASTDAAINEETGGANVATVGIMANVGPVALDAWYLDLTDILDTYTVGAKGTFGPVTVDARYTNLDLESSNNDNSLFVAKVSGKAGPVALWAQVGFTDKDGGLTALENSAKTTVEGWNVTLNGKADADYYGVGASMDVMSGLNVALNYRDIDYANDSEETELYTQITHKMGKNLVTYVRFGQYDKEVNNKDTADSTRGRLQVEYKF